MEEGARVGKEREKQHVLIQNTMLIQEQFKESIKLAIRAHGWSHTNLAL